MTKKTSDQFLIINNPGAVKRHIMDFKEILKNLSDSVIGKIFVPVLLPMAKNLGIDGLVNYLQALKESDSLLYKCVLHSTYPWVDGQLERLATLTEIRIDDDAVSILKGALEKSAAANGETLVNVDSD